MSAAVPQLAHIDALYEEARDHKSEERRHRRLAKEKMQKRDALIAECARLGIEVRFNRVPRGEQ
jgi:hypothetical protein